jgi:hypothetical protein
MRAMRISLLLAGALLVAGSACVSVGDAPGASGSDAASASASASPSASAPAAAPGELSVDEPSPWKADPKSWSVTLTWEAPADFVVGHYEVTRDGRTIAKNVATTKYVDDGAEPAAGYRYAVTGFDAAGGHTAAATATVDTGSPPVADARLEGRFGMKMHITSQSGLTSGASGGGLAFLYDPHCGTGPCDVTWTRQGSSAGGTLARDGASYRGTVHAPFLIGNCHGGALTETLVLATRVTQGGVVHHEWRATKIEGTLDESAPASGCVTARISWSYTGFAQA